MYLQVQDVDQDVVDQLVSVPDALVKAAADGIGSVGHVVVGVNDIVPVTSKGLSGALEVQPLLPTQGLGAAVGQSFRPEVVGIGGLPLGRFTRLDAHLFMVRQSGRSDEVVVDRGEGVLRQDAQLQLLIVVKSSTKEGQFSVAILAFGGTSDGGGSFEAHQILGAQQLLLLLHHVHMITLAPLTAHQTLILQVVKVFIHLGKIRIGLQSVSTDVAHEQQRVKGG